MKTQSLGVGLLLLVVLSGCGSSDAASDGARSAPSVHRVGARDSGELVELAVGDRLVVALEQVPQAKWRLIGYPGGLLELVERRPQQARYEFDATAEGRGSLTLRLASDCSPRMLRPCRVGKDGDADSGRPPLYGRAFRLSVQVVSGGD